MGFSSLMGANLSVAAIGLFHKYNRFRGWCKWGNVDFSSIGMAQVTISITPYLKRGRSDC